MSMLLSPSGERLGDHVAGTIVIRLDRPQRGAEIRSCAKGAGVRVDAAATRANRSA